MPSHNACYTVLHRNENQVRGLAQYALDFLAGRHEPGQAALARTELFHTDSVACAVAALGCGTNAPRLLREEALQYATAGPGPTCFGSTTPVQPEKAVLANSAAVRELDANGTNFGYNPRTGDMRGEFGHHDFFPVVIAAAIQARWDGAQTLRAMLCLEEIRGRLAEVYGLKDHKIDHVVHGGIASAIVYAAALGATIDHIESAVGLLVAHHVPFRAIRHGRQLSDSKGASAAMTAEMAVLGARRAMRGFIGPADIFRNPQALFCLFEPPEERETSPFDLQLVHSGDEFAVMGMHFKLGLYEHQSAGAIHGLLELLARHPQMLTRQGDLRQIRIRIYEPAFSIIGDPAKRDPRTRQSADHSMVYIIATLLRKAIQSREAGWESLMLLPHDYDESSLQHPLTRDLMQRIQFEHGGAEYDARYPDGIPTSLEIDFGDETFRSGLVMYPIGHARDQSGRLESLLSVKFQRLAAMGVDDPQALARRVTGLADKSPEEIRELYSFPLASHCCQSAAVGRGNGG